ncbi:MAG: D-glycero-beta-D-manno-heptose 1-phosphate adenylyltransferase [Candidatus Hydrothermae bacterium]|uniref:D-glycero-beta-D-manno-heptose 1-phosphate adenylyltransferase n=1 Tax=candidate division WOR-3 bacterium TaxID=2052148 RepID=A0A7C0X9P8_UNCW3|nr:D-glycero-beta-D-manno-heptose 1-phosphate adenylyltransferase [Candidatus Hydrothermae bacterium]RKY96296.1 MAG: D-glycero-beta-D-manno-heptose 1-phosphate adenylyltransferase [Candidatus Hydrothermae bacterium]HDM90541.1 D-glycero-beta-D-manno-heptose 1-phosphate adenylyltransferase [candidate division WOR-3 bacterium]
MRFPEEKFVERKAIGPLCEKLRKEGKRIVFTNGCFDLLHRGHVEYLYFARKQGDVLVVGINSDESVRRLKGKGRPLSTLRDRMYVLASLEPVDFVVPFEEDTPYELIRDVLPDILVKGRDYRPDEVVGKDIVEARGGKLVLADYLEGYSTTGLIRKIREMEG